MFDELVQGYANDSIDWDEVAIELARQGPMDPAPARTAKQYSKRFMNLRELLY